MAADHFATPDLRSALTSLAFSWRIVRRDGVALGFTSHDADVHFDGLKYRSSPGVSPSAVMLNDALDVDTMELTGAISSESISEEDLRAGRYDGATVTFLVMDWLNPEAGARVLARGTIGQVTLREQTFTAELRSPSQALDTLVVELFSPECRADLGDVRCRVDLSRFSSVGRVQEGSGSHSELSVTGVNGEEGYYAYGSARVLTGANAGLSRQVVNSSAGRVTVRAPFPYALVAGTLILLRAGCDKLFGTCVRKFGNAPNYRGEPHVPGQDNVLQYKGL